MYYRKDILKQLWASPLRGAANLLFFHMSYWVREDVDKGKRSFPNPKETKCFSDLSPIIVWLCNEPSWMPFKLGMIWPWLLAEADTNSIFGDSVVVFVQTLTKSWPCLVPFLCTCRWHLWNIKLALRIPTYACRQQLENFDNGLQKLCWQLDLICSGSHFSLSTLFPHWPLLRVKWCDSG